MTIIEKVQKWWKNLPEKKKYLEIVTALLSIPVLATAILLNINNLKSKDAPTPTPQSQGNVVTVVPVELKDKETSPTSTSCKKEVGPVEITYPQEGQTVSDNPLCVDIAQKNADYCSVEWSFKLNDGQWSSYTDKQFCFSNLPSGSQELQVRVRSTVSQDQELLERSFTYQNKSQSPTPATSSGTLQ